MTELAKEGHLLGIDSSHYQGEIDFEAAARMGVKFGFFKATEGTSFRDDFFFESTARARHALIWVGSYHFFRPELDPIKQAEYYAETAANASDLRPVIDFETLRGVSSGLATSRALEFIERTEKLWSCQALFYSYPSFIATLTKVGQTPKLSEIRDRTDLWIAHYTKGEPLIVPPFKTWKIHQFDGDGGQRLPSGKDCDFNWFKGSDEDFAREIVRDVKVP